MSHPPRSHSHHRQAPGQAGEQATHLYSEGVTRQAEGKTTLAESAFRRAVSTKPDFAEAHNNPGNVLKEAVGILRASVKAYPGYFDACPNLAEAAFETGAVDDAIKVLQEALKPAPENDAVHARLTEIHCALSRDANCLDRDKLPKTERSVGQWQHYQEPFKSLFERLENR